MIIYTQILSISFFPKCHLSTILEQKTVMIIIVSPSWVYSGPMGGHQVMILQGWISFQIPNVDAELALLMLRSMLETERDDLIESLLSTRSMSEWVEFDPSEDFLLTEVTKDCFNFSKIEIFSSGSISITSLGGAVGVSTN